MSRIACILLCLVACLIPAQAISEKQTREAINRLDKQIARRNAYIDRRQSQIDTLRHRLASQVSASDSVGVMLEIANAYTGFNNDSAITYFRRGYLIASDPMQRTRMRMGMGALLPMAGFNNLAVDIFTNEITPDSLPPDLKLLYYDRARQMYSYVADNYSTYPEFSNHWTALANDCQQHLLDLLPKQSALYKLNLGEYYLNRRQFDRASAILSNLVESEPEESNLRARAANMLSQIAEASHDHAGRIYYLALSSTSDVLSATREVKSLQDLGIELNALGDIERAYSYLSVAMENAVNCHASTRLIESSSALPIIEKAYLAKIGESRRNTMWVIVALALVIALLCVAALRLLKDIRREKSLRERLRQANEVKEFYISRFLSLCSIYMDKLSSLCDIVNRKLTAGKIDDLQRMVRSGKFIEEQSGEFYEVFDDAFLHICPGFVADVNALLQPDKQITLLPGERLNTDLRILAFLRLGIDDASHIARVLNYSVNTVYAYRNRLKARALNRDTFEDAIRGLGK